MCLKAFGFARWLHSGMQGREEAEEIKKKKKKRRGQEKARAAGKGRQREEDGTNEICEDKQMGAIIPALMHRIPSELRS